MPTANLSHAEREKMRKALEEAAGSDEFRQAFDRVVQAKDRLSLPNDGTAHRRSVRKTFAL